MPDEALRRVLEETPVVTQFLFSEDEIIRILALLKYDPNLDLDLIRPAYFTNPIHAQVAEVLLNYRREYKSLPTQSVVEHELQTRFTPSDGSVYPDFLLIESLRVVDLMDTLDLAEIPYYRDRAKNFAKSQRIEQALLRKEAFLAEGRHDDFARLITTAVSIGANLDVPVLDVFDVATWFDSGTEHYVQKIPTRFPTLNLYTRGGLGQGELTTVVAPPSGGKTRFLLQLGIGAMEAGYTPLVFTVELASWKLAARCSQVFLDVTKDALFEDREGTIARMAEYQSHVPNGASIRFMKFLPGIHGMSHLRTEYKRYCTAYGKPPLLIIDYADKVAPEKGVDKRIALENIYMDLFSWAGEEGIHIATATQTNREGAGHTTIKMTDIAECFAKAAISDYIFTLAADPEDPGTTNLYIAKNRDGVGLKSIRIQVNLITQQMAEY